MTTGGTATVTTSALEKGVAIIQSYAPWLPRELLLIWATEWVATGSEQLATAKVRSSPAYERYYPGIKRPDGTQRFANEQEYIATLESFENSLLSININPDLFRSKFVQLIQGDVSPVEFSSRIESIYQRVLSAAPEIGAYYAEVAGIAMTESAMIASVLDPSIGRQILDRTISIAEIGGAASVSGFRLDRAMATRIDELGIDLNTTRQAFQQGQELVPILDTLARRHADPDDDFDVNEFTAAFLLNDPEERRRMRRLLSQEQSSFSNPGIFSTGAGAIAGLLDN